MFFISPGVVYYSRALPSLKLIQTGLPAEFQEHYMLQKISLLLCVVCALLLIACAKSETPTNSETATTANANKAATTTTPATSTTASTAGEKVGVPECDQFIAAYDACVSGKVPEAARAQYKTAIAQWRSSWSKLAENPQTKASLVTACKQAAETARTSMKTYGCTF
jgi:hypothetical protein